MSRANVIAETIKALDEQDYRNGFNDSVLSYCRDALNEFDGSGKEFWSHMCCGRRKEAYEQFMGNDKELIDYYQQVEQQAEGPGAFVMPEWGTRGT